jgi:hypothetical protein
MLEGTKPRRSRWKISDRGSKKLSMRLGDAPQCAGLQITTIAGVLLARAIVLKLATSNHGGQ